MLIARGISRDWIRTCAIFQLFMFESIIKTDLNVMFGDEPWNRTWIGKARMGIWDNGFYQRIGQLNVTFPDIFGNLESLKFANKQKKKKPERSRSHNWFIRSFILNYDCFIVPIINNPWKVLSLLVAKKAILHYPESYLIML